MGMDIDDARNFYSLASSLFRECMITGLSLDEFYFEDSPELDEMVTSINFTKINAADAHVSDSVQFYEKFLSEYNHEDMPVTLKTEYVHVLELKAELLGLLSENVVEVNEYYDKALEMADGSDRSRLINKKATYNNMNSNYGEVIRMMNEYSGHWNDDNHIMIARSFAESGLHKEAAENYMKAVLMGHDDCNVKEGLFFSLMALARCDAASNINQSYYQQTGEYLMSPAKLDEIKGELELMTEDDRYSSGFVTEDFDISFEVTRN